MALDLVIEISGVTRRFEHAGQAVSVLQSVDLNVAPGESVAIRGPSGAGKSTLLSILGLIDLDYTGTYRFKGQDVRQASDAQRGKWRLTELGIAFQDLWLVPSLTALENVLVPLYGANVEPAKANERANALLNRARLGHCLDRRPSELSGGERRRVALARSLANRPGLLILDEPTAELDDVSAEASLDLIRDAARDGATLIVASHDPRVIALCKRDIALLDGNLQRT